MFYTVQTAGGMIGLFCSDMLWSDCFIPFRWLVESVVYCADRWWSDCFLLFTQVVLFRSDRLCSCVHTGCSVVFREVVGVDGCSVVLMVVLFCSDRVFRPLGCCAVHVHTGCSVVFREVVGGC